jgi:neutral ceramidase
MLVGVAREIINPEVGHHLCGYGPDYPNAGVHDDLSVTALYLNDGTRQALLLNFDLIGLVQSTVARFRSAIAKATGVPARNVFLACTHVHSAPEPIEEHPLFKWWPTSNCRKDYMKRLQHWAVQAAGQAKANAEECQLRYNFTCVAENMNRRYSFPDRRYLYIPDNKQLLGQSSEFVDRELGILAFRRKGTQNHYKAIITNYTSHPLCVGNASDLVTADFQGVLRRQVEETFEGCLCLTTTGAAGDNHPLLPESGFAGAERMGTQLAVQTVTRCYDSIPVDYDEQLRLAYPAVRLALKDAQTREMLPEKQARKHGLPIRQRTYRTFVSLLGIGPILLAGFPGEPVAELGAMLKWSSPFLKTYVLFTATDCLGYFPTVNQFYWGGYEPDTTLFARGAGEQLVGRILETAHQLVRRQPLRLPALDAASVHGNPR